MAILDMFDKLDDILYKPVELICDWVHEPLRRMEHKRDMQKEQNLAEIEADRAKAEIEVRVYSNQRSVTLYADGKEIGTQKGSHVFTFRVPLKGETKVRAVSGECEDSAVFNRVDAPNPDYVLKGKSSNSANWV